MLIIKRHTEHQSPVNNFKDIFFSLSSCRSADHIFHVTRIPTLSI